MAVGEPPHSNIHPMRVIFQIPNSPSPTLPDPSQYSADFNDFIKVCLAKNPDHRPSATELLQTHPFIKKAGSLSVMTKLVKQCQPEIDEYRTQEAAEASQKQEQQTQSSLMSNGQSTVAFDLQAGTQAFNTINGTLQLGQTNNSTLQFDNKTIKQPQPKDKQSKQQNQRTIHNPNNDTMVQSDQAGTMVFTTSNTGTLQLDSSTSSNGGKRSSQSEPAYMAHIRESEKQQQNIAQQQALAKSQISQVQASGTLKPANQPSAAAQEATKSAKEKLAQQVTLKPAAVAAIQEASSKRASSSQTSKSDNQLSPTQVKEESETGLSFHADSGLDSARIPETLASESFTDSYRTQKEFHQSTLSASSPSEIKAAIASLAKAYDEEKSQLKQFYSAQEKKFKQLLKAKEKEAKR